jgi:hypothetical protein
MLLVIIADLGENVGVDLLDVSRIDTGSGAESAGGGI